MVFYRIAAEHQACDERCRLGGAGAVRGLCVGKGLLWKKTQHTLRVGRVCCVYDEVLLLADEEGELGEVLEGDASSSCHGTQGVFSNVDLQW